MQWLHGLSLDTEWPVDQIEVHEVDLHCSKRLLDRTFDIRVIRVPQLGCNVEIFSLFTFSKDFCEHFSENLFVFVERGGVDVNVACLHDGVLHGLFVV